MTRLADRIQRHTRADGRASRGIHSFARRAVLSGAVGLAAAVCLAGPTPQDSAIAPRRLVERFDFEESAVFNPGVPPQIYGPAERGPGRRTGQDESGETAGASGSNAIGFAPFGVVSTAEGVGRNGKGYAVRFELDGASMVRFLDASLEGIPPAAQLRIVAWTSTDGLRHAGVRIGACFLDGEERVLGGLVASPVVRAEGSWMPLEIEPPPVPAGARKLQVWLEVVQPAQLAGPERDRLEVARKDVTGTAYFDDIEVWQLPSVRFEAEGDGIVAPGARPRISMRCDDPLARESTAAVRVRDASGAVVFEQRARVTAEREEILEVPQLPTGWYEAEGHFTHAGSEIARRFARFAVLPSDPFEPDQPPRFGASLGSLAVPTEPAIELARSAFVVLPIWSADTELRETAAEIEWLRPVVEELLDHRVEPMFRLGAVPSRLANSMRIEASDALGLFTLGQDRWRPALEPWLLAFGQRVEQWLIGSHPVDGDRGDLESRVRDIADAMSTAIAGPVVTLPWSPSEPLPTGLAAALARGRHAVELVADPAWRESAGEAFAGFPTGAQGMVRIVPLPEGEVDARERAIDLALRAIDAWRAGFDAVAIEVDGAGAARIPGPPMEFAAWRQLSTRLCGRRFIAEIPLADGLRGLLADGARGPVLVAWDASGSDATALEIDLGRTPVTATDLWGRTQRVKPSATGHALRIGREPLFIEGIDRELCLLRRGFRVDPVFAESRRAPQEGDLVLANPWDKVLSGTLTVVSSEGIEISPRTHRVDVPAGGELRIPVRFSVPRSTEAGAIPVRVELAGAAVEPFRVQLVAPLEVGFRSATVEPSWRIARSIESGALDLVLTLRVTNVSDHPIDVEAFAGAEGYPSDRKLVTALAPGATALRAFHFKDGARRLSGRDIRTGIHDPESDARLLRRVAVPPLLPPQPSNAVVGSDPLR